MIEDYLRALTILILFAILFFAHFAMTIGNPLY